MCNDHKISALNLITLLLSFGKNILSLFEMFFFKLFILLFLYLFVIVQYNFIVGLVDGV